MKCGGWDLTVPEAGSVKCSFEGQFAETEDKCELICKPNYQTNTRSLRCMATGGWSPTKNPTCESDGSLTLIIVPIAVGCVLFLLLLVFIYLRGTNRCRSKKRPHDDDVERGNKKTTQYILNTVNRPEVSEKSENLVNIPSEIIKLSSAGKSKKSRNHRWKVKKFQKNISKHFFSKTRRTQSLFRKSYRSVVLPWKQRGPRRVIGKSNKQVKCFSVYENCTDGNDRQLGSSLCECSLESASSHLEIKENTIGRPIKVPSPKLPDPEIVMKKRPKITDKKRRRRQVRKEVEVSSQESSSEDEIQVVRKRKDRYENEDKRRKKASSYKTQKSISEEKRESFDYDYRRKGFVCDGETYHPQNYYVKSYPVKPVLKPRQSESEDNSDREKRLDSHPVGGVKYFSIKPDKNEIKKLKRISRSLSRSSRNTSRKREKSQRQKKSRSRSKSRNSKRGNDAKKNLRSTNKKQRARNYSSKKSSKTKRKIK